MEKNKGFSLVELLLAFAISSIILAGLSYVIFVVLGASGRSNANIIVQSEAQTTLNLIVDQVMEAQGICMEVPAAGSDTKCMLFGDLRIEPAGAAHEAYFNGMALVTQIEDASGNPVKEAYLVEFPNDILSDTKVFDDKTYTKLATSTVSREDAAARSLSKVYEEVTKLTGDAKKAWLLAQHLTECQIELKRDSDLYMETVYYENAPSENTYYFTEPFTVHITLSFEYDYGRGVVDRTLEDDAAVRGRIKKTIFVNKGSGMIEYKRK